MKKNIIKVFLLSITLIIVSTIVILIMGRTHIAHFNIINDNYDFNIDGDLDSVEIIDKKITDDELIITFKSKKEGRIYPELDFGDFQEGKVLYIHKSLIITDNNYFGYSRGSEVIPISISILLLYVLYLLIKEYKTSIKENLYQYKNVAYLGIILFVASFTINNILSIFNYKGAYETIYRSISSMTSLSILLFPLAFITFILVTISNIVLLKKEGKSLRNLLGLFLGIFLCLLTVLPDFVYMQLMKSQIFNIYNLNSAGPYIYSALESFVYLIVTYLEFVLISTIVISIKSVKRKIEYNKDYMIILGCQIRKDGSLTPLLKGRVDRALDFRSNQLKETNKDLIFIPSGGKGNDEVISEAEAMKKYLLDKGIKEKNILVDDKSKNTYENIKFSNKLIKKKNANIAFSTTNYHVFRAGLIASEQGLLLEGIGSKTKSYFWINAFIREFIGTLFSERKKHIIVFGLIIIIIIAMILTTYFANNI